MSMRNRLRPAAFAAFAALVVTVAFLSGCRFMSRFKGNDGKAASDLQEMPRVTFSDLDKAGRKLSAAGMQVVVRREEVKVEGKERSFAIPGSVRPFQAARWNHMVAGQEPPAGTPLRPGMTITLTAGIHHGAGPFRPWVAAHPLSVKFRGEQRCQDCHSQGYCSECHLRAGVADPADARPATATP